MRQLGVARFGASTMATLFLTLVAGCGGAGGSGVASTPVAVSPTPTPAAVAGATDRIIGGATASQTFATEDYAPSAQGGLTVQYEAATGRYLVSTPADTTPAPLQRSSNYAPLPGDPWKMFVGANGLRLQIEASSEDRNPAVQYTYSNLAAWSYANSSVGGYTAFGVPTPATAIPRTGTASFAGFVQGSTSEKCKCGWDGEITGGLLGGTAKLAVDFAAGRLTGSINPKLALERDYELGALALTNVDWGPGRPSFGAALGGAGISNSRVRGTFTGPAAQEVIGSLVFDYNSPVDGAKYTAGGAFIAKQ